MSERPAEPYVAPREPTIEEGPSYMLLGFGLFGLFLLLFAIVSSPHLRFTSVLHGDEPKYIRYAESFYQGLGVDVGHQREFDELTLSYSPPA